MEFKRHTQGNNFKNYLTGMLIVLIVIVIIFMIKRSLPKDVLALLLVVMSYYTYREYRQESILNNTRYILENNILTMTNSNRTSKNKLSDIDYIIENDFTGVEHKLGKTIQKQYWLILKDKKRIKIYDEMKNNRNKSIIEFLNRNCNINIKIVHKFSKDFFIQMLLGAIAVALILFLRR